MTLKNVHQDIPIVDVIEQARAAWMRRNAKRSIIIARLQTRCGCCGSMIHIGSLAAWAPGLPAVHRACHFEMLGEARAA
jgi:hypothetical protein